MTKPDWTHALSGMALGASFPQAPERGWTGSADVTRALGHDPKKLELQLGFYQPSEKDAHPELIGLFLQEAHASYRVLLLLCSSEAIKNAMRGLPVWQLHVLRDALGEEAAYQLAAQLESWHQEFCTEHAPSKPRLSVAGVPV